MPASARAARFQPGRLVLHRHFARGNLAWAPLTRVVRDDQRGLLLWISAGTPSVCQVTDGDHGPRGMPFAEWLAAPKRTIAKVWNGPGILKLVRPGAWHSVWWIFDPAGVFSGWYVNLEQPSATWDDGAVAGVDTTDHDLDIRVAPDRSWWWKDVDEFTERLAFPAQYWVDDPEAVWAEGRRISKLIEAGEYPFDGTLCDFRPDPEWRWPAEVPSGWDRPRAAPPVPGDLAQ